MEGCDHVLATEDALGIGHELIPVDNDTGGRTGHEDVGAATIPQTEAPSREGGSSDVRCRSPSHIRGARVVSQSG